MAIMLFLFKNTFRPERVFGAINSSKQAIEKDKEERAGKNKSIISHFLWLQIK